jgi:hypothetical protein
MKVKKGQFWKSKETGKIIRIAGKGTNERHWIIVKMVGGAKSGRHLHEGTINKFYELLES